MDVIFKLQNMKSMHDEIIASIKGLYLMLVSLGCAILGKIFTLSIPMQTLQYIATIFSATGAGIYYSFLISEKVKAWLKRKRERKSVV